MTGTHSLDHSAAAPDAALVHLSGGRRGSTEFISGDRIVLSPASNGGIELSTNDETPPHSLAVLERRGHTFRLSVTPGTEVWINGERLDELVLASGDVLEFGGGAVLRFRLYPPERRRYKTMGEAFSDCVECARHDSTSPIRRAAVLASRVPPEIMTQTAPRVRLVIVVLAVAAIGLAGSALVRSARVERPFYYVERNFLPGRRFRDWDDLNAQARSWCKQIANQKPKRSLGMSPEAAYVLEKTALLPMPAHLPPVYQAFTRIVDVEGYVHLDTNRYSVPERLVGKAVEVYKYPVDVKVLFRHREVAEHPRFVGKRHKQNTLKAHHRTRRRQVYQEACQEERQLRGESELLNRYVGELKKRSPGRGVSSLRRLLLMRRTYPKQAFLEAVETALQYGLYDLVRLEHLILERVAGDFFQIDPDDEDPGF